MISFLLRCHYIRSPSADWNTPPFAGMESIFCSRKLDPRIYPFSHNDSIPLRPSLQPPIKVTKATHIPPPLPTPTPHPQHQNPPTLPPLPSPPLIPPNPPPHPPPPNPRYLLKPHLPTLILPLNRSLHSCLCRRGNDRCSGYTDSLLVFFAADADAGCGDADCEGEEGVEGSGGGIGSVGGLNGVLCKGREGKRGLGDWGRYRDIM